MRGRESYRIQLKQPVGVVEGLGHPAEAVAWLANRLADFGAGLEAGQVVLPGAMCASVFAQAGESFRADFTSIGSVSVVFA